mgnify:CR=1 FL=1
MEVIGKIKLIGEVQTFGDNGFRKRDVVVTTDDQYPQMISVEFHQDKTDLLNNYKVGQDVKISINLTDKKYSLISFNVIPIVIPKQIIPPIEEPDNIFRLLILKVVLSSKYCKAPT